MISPQTENSHKTEHLASSVEIYLVKNLRKDHYEVILNLSKKNIGKMMCYCKDINRREYPMQ